MNFNIAIDGPAGAGKSTIAKMLAKKISYIYIDTGAMYRAIALYFLNNKLNINDEKIINENLMNIDINIKYVNNIQLIILNNVDVTELIRTPEVGKAASIVSTYKLLRERLVKIQQELANKNNVIMDGRDIGTVVLPTANLKIYLTASVEERAIRRYRELKDKGQEVSLSIIKNDIRERDYRDMNRKISPLKQADDAYLVDTSNMTIDEVVNKIYELYELKRK